MLRSIAGRLGVAIAHHLQKAGHVVLDDGAGQISASGHAFFAKLGLDVSQGGSRGHRALCRPCLDWSERRYHIGGTLGRVLCEHCLSEAWIERERDTRALIITEAGREAFDSLFGWASMDEEEGACREETAFEAGAFP